MAIVYHVPGANYRVGGVSVSLPFLRITSPFNTATLGLETLLLEDYQEIRGNRIPAGKSWFGDVRTKVNLFSKVDRNSVHVAHPTRGVFYRIVVYPNRCAKGTSQCSERKA